MAQHPAHNFIRAYEGPSAIVRACSFCNFIDTVRKPRAGERGRGWGFREGNKQRGRLIQHIKENHPEKLPGGTV